MEKKLIKLTILTTVFSVGLGLVVKNNVNQTVTPVSAAQHIGNFDEYEYNGDYYKNIDDTDGGMQGDLRKALTDLIYPKAWYGYSGGGSNTLTNHLQQADEDPSNKSNMIYFYTRDSVAKNAAGSWNREHVWPQSLSGTNPTTGNDNYGTGPGAGSDLLHIRPTYNTPNSKRGSLKMADVNKQGAVEYNNMVYGYIDSNKFEPLDSVKGDVARIFMYVWTAYYKAYGGSMDIQRVIYNYDTLIKWHTMDKPDEMEGHRNDYAENSIQKNRNPFVDHPEYAWKIFGEKCSNEVLTECQEAYPGNGTGLNKTLVSIAITGEATKKDYYAGESFKPAGLTVTATYDDDSTKVINNDNCSWTPNPLTEGTTSVTCTYKDKTATYSGITVTKKTVPPVVGGVYSCDFKAAGADSGDRLTGATIMESHVENNTLIKSADVLEDNIFPGTYGLKFGSSRQTGSIKFTLEDKATAEIEKVEVVTTAYGTDVCHFNVKLDDELVIEGAEPGKEASAVLDDVSATTLTISSSEKRFYLNKIIITIKNNEPLQFEGVSFDDLEVTYDGKAHILGEVKGAPEGTEITYRGRQEFTEVGVYPATALLQKEGYADMTLEAALTIKAPDNPGPGSSSSSNPASSNSESSESSNNSEVTPEPSKKSGCNGSIALSASLAGLTALVGLVFVFSKKKEK